MNAVATVHLRPKDVTAETFANDVIEFSKTVPVLVDFWAEWCGPCKQLMPTLHRLVEEYGGRFVLAKVNTDEQQELSAQLGIRSLPTVVLFKEGKVADHFLGAVPEAQIRQMLDRHLPPPAKTPIQAAREFLQQSLYSEAAAVLNEALIQDPLNVELQCALGETRILSSDIEGGKQLLETAKSREPNSQAVKRLTAIIEFSDIVQAHPDIDALRQQLARDPENLDARHALAVHRLLSADYDAALEDWLNMMRTNRKYKDDLARRSLVMAFELIGSHDPRVVQTRREMARLLF
jgi:putative thioredoxin